MKLEQAVYSKIPLTNYSIIEQRQWDEEKRIKYQNRRNIGQIAHHSS